MKLYKKWKK